MASKTKEWPDEMDQMYESTLILGDKDNNPVDKALVDTVKELRSLEDLKKQLNEGKCLEISCILFGQLM